MRIPQKENIFFVNIFFVSIAVDNTNFKSSSFIEFAFTSLLASISKKNIHRPIQFISAIFLATTETPYIKLR